MRFFRPFFLLLCAALLLSGCHRQAVSIGIIGGADGPTRVIVSESTPESAQTLPEYESISQEKAKEIMDSGEDCIILDVREQAEYDSGHIPGAVLMPHGSTRELAPSLLPDKDALILVYCRSGRRSKIAAAALAELGYPHVLEFGGIQDWPYAIE